MVAGPVSMVAFRVPPVSEGQVAVRAFKVMVRLEAGAEVTVQTGTAGTALFYDRARFDDGDVHQLTDGEQRVRFVGCPDGPAVFSGAVLTDGPTTVDLELTAGGWSDDVRVAPFDG